MKHARVALIVCFLLAGCDGANVWTAEACNDALEATLRQIDDSKQLIKKLNANIQAAERRGDTALAAHERKTLESQRVEGIGGNLKYLDTDLLKNCDQSTLRADLVQRIPEARKPPEAAGAVAQAEGLPDLRVTGIDSTFIPYELNERGECSGPYLDLKFTVTNRGGDYPRPVDLQEYEKRAQKPADSLQFFTVTGELDFGGDMRKRVDKEIGAASGGKIPSGASLTIPAKIRIDYNQTQARAKGYLQSVFFLKAGSGTIAYEEDIDVPLWDIYTESHIALTSKDEDGKPYFGAIATVTNKGKTPTPGPIQGSFVLNDLETGRYITGWSGQTEGPVSGSTKIVYKEPFTGTLPKKLKIQSSIIPLCPDGKVGNLADGDAKNNVRELIVQGSEQQAKEAAVDMMQQEKK